MPKGNGKMYNDKYNAPDTYTDMDGQSKNFTHINYSKKSKMSFQMKEELQDVHEELRDYKLDLQDRILALPPSMFPMEYQDFIIRDIPNEKITWNEAMIRDAGVSTNKLRDLYVLTDNKFELYGRKLPY